MSDFFDGKFSLFDDLPKESEPKKQDESYLSPKNETILEDFDKFESIPEPQVIQDVEEPLIEEIEKEVKPKQNKEAAKPKRKVHKRVALSRKKAYAAASCLFVLTLAALFVISFDIGHRPKISDAEKRELTQFPKLTFSALVSGDFFDGINLWFADTFPFRDSLISASKTVKSCIGISKKTTKFAEIHADDIPDAKEEEQSQVDINVDFPNSSGDIMKPALPSGGGGGISGNAQAEGNNVIAQTLNSIYVYGNTGYEYYNFVQSTADRYASAVNAAASELKASGINVYNMIIPTSIDITLNDNTRSKLNSSNQKEAIDYINSKLSSDVKKVQIFNLLKAHKDEYLYFRTDHHWTSLGAYYAYAQFMSVKGGKYEPLSNFTEYSFSPFLGSFYSDTGKSSALEATPDTVYAYMPPYNNTFKMLEKGKTQYTDWSLICDASSYSSSYKYLCFIGGDNPVSVVENTDMQSGETCVLVKESFGNAFAPYLICNYKYVYIIDYRHFTSDITNFAKEKGATDVIIQNNISMTRNSDLVTKLSNTL